MPVLGRFVATESGVVSSRIAERISLMMVQVGDRVKKGDTLARMSSDQLNNRVELRIAELRRAKAILQRQTANLLKKHQVGKRVEALRGSNAFRLDREEDSQRDIEIARASVEEAKAEVLRAQSNLGTSRISLADSQIKAPYSGVIIAKHKVAGNYARIGDPIVTILNDLNLEIEADVPTIRAMELIPNIKVEAKLQNGTKFGAKVRVIIPHENMQTRTLAVRFTLDQTTPRGRLAGNQSVILKIPISKPTGVVTVHKDAILVKKGQKLVYVVEAGKANIRTVKIGRSIGERFEVLKGLRPGDVVVIRGNERLRPGETVEPVS
tara:strand:- start:521 stop:1489 length:969 start_codon:yes stop_codon:yes gene_type:complete